jgi:hypothetical protein
LPLKLFNPRTDKIFVLTAGEVMSTTSKNRVYHYDPAKADRCYPVPPKPEWTIEQLDKHIAARVNLPSDPHDPDFEAYRRAVDYYGYYGIQPGSRIPRMHRDEFEAIRNDPQRQRECLLNPNTAEGDAFHTAFRYYDLENYHPTYHELLREKSRAYFIRMRSYEDLDEKNFRRVYAETCAADQIQMLQMENCPYSLLTEECLNSSSFKTAICAIRNPSVTVELLALAYRHSPFSLVRFYCAERLRDLQAEHYLLGA